MTQEKIEFFFDKDYPKDTDVNFVGSIYDIYEKAFKSGMKAGFDKGFIVACAVTLKNHGCEQIVEDTLTCNTLSRKEMVNLGIDESDIKTLQPVLQNIKRKANLHNPSTPHQ